MRRGTCRFHICTLATVLFLTMSYAAQTIPKDVNSSDEQNRNSLFAYRVELKRDHIASLNKLSLLDRQDIKSHSAKWLAAMAAIDAEIAKIVARLGHAHPHVQISSVTGRKSPSFIMRGSDEESKAMANEAAVESIENLGPANELIENIFQDIWE
jgi:hypothetical protein